MAVGNFKLTAPCGTSNTLKQIVGSNKLRNNRKIKKIEREACSNTLKLSQRHKPIVLKGRTQVLDGILLHPMIYYN